MTRSKLAAVGGLVLAWCLALALAACGSPGGQSATSGTASARAAGSNQAATPAAPTRAQATSASTQAAPSATGASVPVGTTSDLRTNDSPVGFWYGSDSWPIPVTGNAPYSTPRLGGGNGGYGGYIGMAGNWARWQGCGTGNFLAWSGANSQQADANYTRYGAGVGTGVYWYMGGPGVDPQWNGTATEAGAWGARQAAAALASIAGEQVTYPILFMDIEMPGIAPAPDNGWSKVYTSPCSGIVKPAGIPADVARAEFNGFAGYLTAHSHYKTGVYSEPGTWTQVFGTGSAAQIPNTYEWTYEPETANLGDAPRGWCLTGAAAQCAQFFGGVTSSSSYAVMWQWSGGGGVRNPIGDFDQISTSRIR